jgi:protein arginine kinase activator
MQCENCHEREACVQLTQVSGGELTKMHLCERCAAEKGVESAASVEQNPFAKLVAASMAGKGQGDKSLGVLAGSSAACSRCGATLQDFRETGRLGCPECYRSFEGPLRDLLRRLHGSTVHVGKRYTEPGAQDDPRRREAELREQLRLAVETENFELAAELRDRLRVME